MPENSTSFIMTNLQGNLKKTLGDLYGLRTWVEYGFRQCKQELGWTDYRFTNFQHIERWWEIIFCVYTMISLNPPVFLDLNKSCQLETEIQEDSSVDFSNHKLEPLTCTIPVVAVTALASTEDRERILKAGFNDYISKPYMLEEFEAIIRRGLEKFVPYPALNL